MRFFFKPGCYPLVNVQQSCLCQSNPRISGNAVRSQSTYVKQFSAIADRSSSVSSSSQSVVVGYRNFRKGKSPIIVIGARHASVLSSNFGENLLPATEKDLKRMKIKKGNSGGTEFYDSLRVFAKGGNGGQGLPQKGGIGGKGGDVIAVGHKNTSLKKIMELFPTKRFIANSGADSKNFCLIGEPGKNVLVPVPLGVTVISEYGQRLGEINTHGEKLVIAKGGLGGAPSNGFSAQEGQKHNVSLDLKLIADVGFVGFPNAGKSTLLKALSKANPKIASYPFTTIRPNVGVIEYSDYRTITLADLPGLIEGAHANIGLGHKFLKHVERTKVLLFVVDLHGFQLSPKHPVRSALETIVLLNKELELYKEELTEKPAILALNKMDIPGSYNILQKIKETLSGQFKYQDFLKTMPREYLPENVLLFDDIVPISAAKDDISVNELKRIIRKVLDYHDKVENRVSTTG